MLTLQALSSSLSAGSAERGCLGPGEAFGCCPAVCPPKRPRPFAHYKVRTKSALSKTGCCLSKLKVLGVSSLHLPCEIAKANFWQFRMGFPHILVDAQSIFCDFQSVSVSFNQLQSTLFSFNQLDSGIPKVGKTHLGALLETEILKAGIPKSGIPKTRIPNLGIPKLGIPKTGRVTAPVVQTPFRLPLIFPSPN